MLRSNVTVQHLSHRLKLQFLLLFFYDPSDFDQHSLFHIDSLCALGTFAVGTVSNVTDIAR